MKTPMDIDTSRELTLVKQQKILHMQDPKEVETKEI